MDTADIFTRGGPVVYILAFYSVIALAIVIERYIHFIRMGFTPRSIEEGLGNAISDGGLKDPAITKGPEAAIIREMLAASSRGVDDIGRVASRVGSEELQRMERGFRTLAFLGNTAPLLGLLGTITGMIKAFMVIEQAGGKVDANALAGGIWEAMITTGVGLSVSIPILFFLHLLEGSADRRANSMKRIASMILEKLHHHHEREIPVDVIHHRKGAADGV